MAFGLKWFIQDVGFCLILKKEIVKLDYWTVCQNPRDKHMFSGRGETAGTSIGGKKNEKG